MMNIKAIPTEYNGVQFRSRLEARWAAFFDQMKWRWAYEPFDLNGWIPDFVVGPDFETGAYVEVKPIDWQARPLNIPHDELNHAADMTPATSRGFLVCGLRPVLTHPDGGPMFDAIGVVWEPRWTRWRATNIRKKGDVYDVCVGSQGDYPGLMTGAADFTDGDFPKDGEVESLWNRAGNAVQWKSPHRNSLIPA